MGDPPQLLEMAVGYQQRLPLDSLLADAATRRFVWLACEHSCVVGDDKSYCDYNVGHQEHLVFGCNVHGGFHSRVFGVSSLVLA